MDTMNTVQFIVDRLNAPPFNSDLTLVTFDGKTSFELLQTLNDVLAHLDKRHAVDLRDEPQDATAARMVELLRLLKYPLPQRMDQFQADLLQGQRTAIYPLLHFLLSRLPQLQKRAYLARFLVNIEVPQQFLHNPDVSSVYKLYKEKRHEFAETHKTVDRLRSNSLAPRELNSEIVQLEEEKHQLQDKIASLKRKTSGLEGFETLLKVTSALRQEQETSAKLQEQTLEQTSVYRERNERCNAIQQRVEEMRRTMRGAVDPRQILEQLQKQSMQLDRQVGEELAQQLSERQGKLAQLQETLSEPQRTKGDIIDMQSTVRRFDEEVRDMQRHLDQLSSKRAGDNLQVFRQQAALIAKKREQKETQVERAIEARKRLAQKVQQLEGQSSDAPEGMTPAQLREFKRGLVGKIEQFKEKKRQLGRLQAETVVLTRTEAILKSRCANLEEVLARIESSKGVKGYTSTQNSLELVSTASAALNQTKGKTLEEISKIVTEINHAVEGRKAKIKPLIEKLRGLRPQFQELQSEYLEGKSFFENTAAGFESERVKLENEANSYQQDCQREESRYHMLQCMKSISAATVERAQLEESFRKGEAEFLPQFRSFQELYNNKIQQQQNLSQELRKHQHSLRDAAPADTRQRGMFENLRHLLEQKAACCRRGNNVSSGVGSSSTFDVYGATNIMTLKTEGSP